MTTTPWQQIYDASISLAGEEGQGVSAARAAYSDMLKGLAG